MGNSSSTTSSSSSSLHWGFGCCCCCYWVEDILIPLYSIPWFTLFPIHTQPSSSNFGHIPNYIKFSELFQTQHNICPEKLANFLHKHTHTLTSTCAQDTTTTTCWWWVGWLVWECSRTWPFSVAIFTQSQVFGLSLDYVVQIRIRWPLVGRVQAVHNNRWDVMTAPDSIIILIQSNPERIRERAHGHTKRTTERWRRVCWKIFFLTQRDLTRRPVLLLLLLLAPSASVGVQESIRRNRIYVRCTVAPSREGLEYS